MEALRIKANTVPCTALFFLASAYGLFALCMGIVRSGNGTLVVFPRRVQRDLFPRPPGGPRAVFRGGHSIRRPDCGIPSFSARVRRGGPGASRPWLCLRRDGRVAASFPRTLFSPADMERAVRYLRSAGVPLKERY